MKVYALSHEPVVELKMFQDELGDTVTLLSDPEGKAIEAFAMLDKAAFPKKKQARAGVFHIDRKGMIRHIWLTDNYRRRPAIEAILKAIKG